MKFILVGIMIAGAFVGCEGPPKTAERSNARAGVSEMSPTVASKQVDAAYTQFIDVRTAEEFASGHAPRARNIPLDRLENSLVTLRKDEPVYVICETGRRSAEASDILLKNGFEQIISITGGTAQWKADGLPIQNPTPKPTPSISL